MKTTIERAYELAGSGSCKTIKDIERQLQKEQRESIHAHLQSTVLKKQLKALMNKSRAQQQA
jgi:hypothetical protein